MVFIIGEMKMGITEEGIKAEKLGRGFLLKYGIKNMQQIDWIFKYKDKYGIVEVKARELFKPPPFLGTGLDIRQLNLRKQLYNDLGIDTLLLVYEKNTNNIYHQWLSKLEKCNYIDTKNRIRIYDIKNFIKEGDDLY